MNKKGMKFLLPFAAMLLFSDASTMEFDRSKSDQTLKDLKLGMRIEGVPEANRHAQNLLALCGIPSEGKISLKIAWDKVVNQTVPYSQIAIVQAGNDADQIQDTVAKMLTTGYLRFVDLGQAPEENERASVAGFFDKVLTKGYKNKELQKKVTEWSAGNVVETPLPGSQQKKIANTKLSAVYGNKEASQVTVSGLQLEALTSGLADQKLDQARRADLIKAFKSLIRLAPNTPALDFQKGIGAVLGIRGYLGEQTQSQALEDLLSQVQKEIQKVKQASPKKEEVSFKPNQNQNQNQNENENENENEEEVKEALLDGDNARPDQKSTNQLKQSSKQVEVTVTQLGRPCLTVLTSIPQPSDKIYEYRTDDDQKYVIWRGGDFNFHYAEIKDGLPQVFTGAKLGDFDFDIKQLK